MDCESEGEGMTSMVKNPDGKFGRALVEAAREKYQQSNKELIVSQVGDLFKKLEKYEELKAKIADGVNITESKIKAVEAGEFTVRSSGKIEFTDESLNKSLEIDPITQQCWRMINELEAK
jgi:hypothetical protein